MPGLRSKVRILCLAVTACATLALPAPCCVSQEPSVQRQSFDHDPGWEGFRNRLLPDSRPIAKQDFGFRPTNHAGGKRSGEIGGVIQRAARRASYAKRISPKSLRERLSASGTFSVRRADGGSGVLIGWFNDIHSQGWRTPDSLAFRIDGNGGKYWLFYEYGTTNRATGGGGAFDGPRYQTTVTLPFMADGTVHQWSLSYDPGGDDDLGIVKFQVDDRSYLLPLHPGHKKRGADFDRFGIWNQQAPGGSMEVYLDDLIIDGQAERFDIDPDWDGAANGESYEQQIVRPFHHFGYSRTQVAGGELGEIGGIVFRDENPAYYADPIGPLSLDSELQASGTMTLRTAGADSGVMLGWFNAAKKKSKSIPEDQQPLTDYLGIMIEGPSRVGHYFRAAYSTSDGNHHAPTGEGTVDERPVVLPGDQVHRWSLHYQPRAASRNGRMTVVFDGNIHRLDLDERASRQGAKFDRFGLFNIQSGGHHVEVFVDDLRYSK